MDSSDSSYYSRQQLDELFLQMIAFFSGDPKRIQHFMKVHSFARIIGTKEGLDETSLFILEAAAYTHDIGIRPAEEKYGRCDGKLQEQEGPIVAQRMLSDVGIENYLIDRICYLIGHHHTSKDWIIRFWWRQIFWSIYMKMTSIVTELNRHISKFSGRRPEKKFLIRCIQMKDE